ncbi:invasion associated locus B family protein [Chenggangzhangella methanolivorans]|uniref:Invasion associated locus B family protein n=1 Tax=Chenggangzhangella methanolivorans TaxID=1437009 RepID=A0A9E6RI59_9HYPH|nr:invasion associated locus B family protein [Chenggangzhangella methanolivorans]QZO01896.1 invasion associated locus B family protein [Chenggangzhangella methanolivorans]
MIDRAPLLFAAAAGAVIAGLWVSPSSAQAPAGVQPTQIGEFKDWNAYAAPVKGGKVCYALATPQKSRRRSAQAPEGAYFFISNRPQDGVNNEVSVMPGFQLKAGSEVELTVDGATFKLFTRGDGAFMGNNEDQAALVEAMRGGRRDMSVEATPSRGRKSTQSYSLSGLSAALDKINQECRAAAPRAR